MIVSMKRNLIFYALVLMVCGTLSSIACAKDNPSVKQPAVSQPKTEGFTAEYVCSLIKPENKNWWTQGMDIYKDYLVNCRNQGYAYVYKFDGKNVEKLGEFRLESYDVDNHANVASFGKQFYDKNDPMPLLYVSQAAKNPWKGYKDVLLVERIAPDFASSKLVQVIYYEDKNKDFDYALQWVVDDTGKYLYAYGNTTRDKDIEGNKHRIAKFRMPSLADSNADGMVILHPEDALENYTIEDCGYKFATIGQGLYVRKGKLYMPVGAGSEKYPAYLYVWNLKKRCMEVAADLNSSGMGEPEDMSWHKGTFIISAVNGLYSIEL